MVAGCVGRTDVAVLRDGRVVEVRPVEPEDKPRILRFLQDLSVDTVYSRFFSLTPDLARQAAACTDEGCFGLLAVPLGQVFAVGHAGYWLLQASRAEMAIAVADDYQGRGLGSVLLRRLADAARRTGVQAFQMDVLPFNLRVINLLSRSGFPFQAWLSNGVIQSELVIGAAGADRHLTQPWQARPVRVQHSSA